MNDLPKKPRKKFEQLLRDMKDLPSIKASVGKVLVILDDPESDGQEVAAAIAMDQTLSMRVLKIVNSAYYGFPRKIDTLDHAVALLGYRSLREIVLVTSLFGELNRKTGSHSMDRDSFWRHAVGCGTAARTVAEKIGANCEQAAYLAGLMHDIGKVVMDTCLREQYAEVVDYAQKRNLLLIEAEESVLGVNHTDFGHWLSDSWNLPLNLTVPVLYHHAPHRTPDHYLLSCLVHMGDILARSLELGSGGDETIPAINRRAWASLKLNRPFLAQLVPEIYNQMERLPFEI